MGPVRGFFSHDRSAASLVLGALVSAAYSVALAGAKECPKEAPISVEIESSTDDLKTLVTAYGDSSWEQAHATALKILDEGRRKIVAEYATNDAIPDALENALNGQDRCSVVFLDTTAIEPVPARILVHAGSGEEFSATIPGQEWLYVVLLSDKAGTTLQSDYEVTRKANPLVAALSKFVAQFNPLLAKLEPPPEARMLVPPPAHLPVEHTIYMTVAPVCLRHKRADIKVHDVITDVPEPGTKTFKHSLDTKSQKIAATSGSLSRCAANLNTSLKNRVACELARFEQTEKKQQSEPTQCDGVPPTPVFGCGESVKLSIPWRRCVLRNVVEVAYSDCLTSVACCSSTANVPSEIQADAVATTYKAYENLIDATTERKADFTYLNQPPTKWTFGIIAAGIISDQNDDRIKLDGGNLTKDPITSVLSMAVVNIQPWGFDGTTFKMAARERPRLFLGATLTPEFGVNGGIGFAIVRGFSVNIGYSLFWVNKLRTEDSLGAPPSSQEDPFTRGTIGVSFLGLGYNFE